MATDLLTPANFDEPNTHLHLSPVTWVHELPRTLLRVTADSVTPGVPKKMRSKLAPTFELTERDVKVLQALHRLRVLERQQIERLFFPNFSMACRRLRLLYKHGFIESLYRPPKPNRALRGPAYRLATRGAKLLADEQGVRLAQFYYWGKTDDRRGHQTERTGDYLEHALELSSIRIAIEQAAAASSCTIALWRDELEMRRMRIWDEVAEESVPGATKMKMKVTPDSYFVLDTALGRRGHFFIEADRGTESVAKRWRQKIFGYKEFFSSKAFHKRYRVGDERTAFRVLTVTNSLLRAHNLRAATEKYGSPQQSLLFLFAPISDVTGQDVLSAPIWLRGGTTASQALL